MAADAPIDPPVLDLPDGFDKRNVVDSRLVSYLIVAEHWQLVTACFKAVGDHYVANPELSKGLFTDGGLGSYREDLDPGWFDSAGVGKAYFVPESFESPSNDGFVPLGEYSLYPTDGTQLGASSMVTGQAAAECAYVHMQKIALRIFSSMKKRNSYRSFLIAKKSNGLALLAVQRLYAKIRGALKPQNAVTGPRFMSVRNWRYGVGWGKHCWRPASHRRPGRKAHPAWRWLELNDARNKRRRKTERPYRFKNRKPAKPRPTRHKRPLHPDGV